MPIFPIRSLYIILRTRKGAAVAFESAADFIGLICAIFVDARNRVPIPFRFHRIWALIMTSALALPYAAIIVINHAASPVGAITLSSINSSNSACWTSVLRAGFLHLAAYFNVIH
jgi:hypothetical protein